MQYANLCVAHLVPSEQNILVGDSMAITMYMTLTLCWCELCLYVHLNHCLLCIVCCPSLTCAPCSLCIHHCSVLTPIYVTAAELNWTGSSEFLDNLPTSHFVAVELNKTELKADVQQVDAFYQWCLRRILDIHWHDLFRNDAVRRMTEQAPLRLSSTTDSLFGHVAWMNELANASQILFAQLPDNWRRPPGRPRSSWIRNFCSDLSSFCMELPEAREVASTFLADVNEA